MTDNEPQTLERSIRVAQYGVIVLAGVAALIFTPRTIEGALGEGLTLAWSIVAVVGGILAALGAAADRYRVELAAVWLTAGGVSAYAVTIWGLTLAETPTRSTQALMVTALVLSLWLRGATLGRRAARARRAYTTFNRRG